ncbi:MAG: PEGA domain-containing protein [Chitinispirillia bacterium]|jgi:hypothetical protein
MPDLNKFIIITAIGLYLILISSCTTQEGIIASQELTGSIHVIEKNDLDADIFINHKNTGQTTANGIIKNLPIGEYRIQIHLDNYKSIPEYYIIDIIDNSFEKINFELKPTDYGELYVTTSPNSALVMVDSMEFGYTPLNLNGIITGEHSISFYAGNYTAADTILHIKKSQKTTLHRTLSLKQSVIVEHFSNTSCLGCSEISALIVKTIEDKDNPQFFDIEYHPSVPSPDDIMYKANSFQNDIIFNFYSPPYLPFIFVDGISIDKFEPNEIKSQLDTLLDERIRREPEYSLSIQKGFSDSGEVYVHAVKKDISGLYLKVHCIQSKIEFDNAQGINGEKEFFNIFCGSVPDPNGIKIILSQGESKKMPIYFNSGSYTNITLYMIAYLQDIKTKEIKQSTKVLWK